MKIEIKSWFTGHVIITGEYESIKECLEKNGDAYLGGADLMGAYLGSGRNHLPEPPPDKIKALIEALSPITQVKIKDNLKRLGSV